MPRRSPTPCPGDGSVASPSTRPVPHPTHADEDHHPLRARRDRRAERRRCWPRRPRPRSCALDKVRADTTVVEANVAYPTDSGLLALGVAQAGATDRPSSKPLGFSSRTGTGTAPVRCAAEPTTSTPGYVDATTSPKQEVYAINAEMAQPWPSVAVADARAVILNARRSLRTRGSDASGTAAPRWPSWNASPIWSSRSWPRPALVLAASRARRSTRVVSLHDPDARPIVKGRLCRPVEFGYLAQVVDNLDGIVLDHGVHIGNPPDAPMLAPAIATHQSPLRSRPASGGRRPRLRRSRRRLHPHRQSASAAWPFLVAGRPGRRPPDGSSAPDRSVTWSSGVPASRPHQSPQTRLLLEPHPSRRHRRRTTWCGLGVARPQRRQDHRPHRRTRLTSNRTVNRIEAVAALRFTTSSRTPHRFRRLTVRRSRSSRPHSTKEPVNIGSTK